MSETVVRHREGNAKRKRTTLEDDTSVTAMYFVPYNWRTRAPFFHFLHWETRPRLA